MPDSPALPHSTSMGRRLLRRFGKGGVALLALLAVMLVTAIGFSITAEKPWGRTVQKRLQKQEALKPGEYAIIGLWWGAVANAAVLVVLLGAAGKWMPEGRSHVQGPGTFKVQGPTSKVGATTEKWMLLIVLGAVVFGAWERWPKLSQSYWNDEAYSLNRFVRGDWERQKDGTMAFEPVTWTDTLFENRNANNHLLNSLLARLSLDSWRTITGAPADAFREAVTRLPNFLAGLGTIFLMFLLGREIGSPLVGAGSAWLLALHPWHVRYATEMRGYGLMLFFMTLSLLALVRALRTERIRWWLLFSAGEALFLLSFPGALYVAFAVNGVCAIELALRKEWGRIGRLTAFNALAAVPVVQWMLPSVPQIINWLREEQPAYVTDVGQWLHDLASVLIVGWQYDNPWRESHVGTDWKGVAAHFPLPTGVTVVIVAGLCLTGLFLAGRRGTAARVVVIAPVIAALISLAVNLRPGSPMTVWYLIYLLIPTTLAVPLALEGNGLDERLRPLSRVLCLVFVLCYGFGTMSAVTALRDHDRQPMRQTVALIHSQAQNVMSATFGVSDRQHSAYDPHVVVLESEADLDRCITQSRAASTPLYVYFCSDDQAQKRRPQIYERLTKSGAFDKVKEFPGSEELWSYRVYRLKPAP